MIMLDNIEKNLNSDYIGQQIIYLDTVASTNDYLKELAKDADNEGLVVIANEQTNGKGRLGRSWISGSGDSIIMSILLKPQTNIEKLSLITTVAAVSIVEALNRVDVNANIKWPNDIYLYDKKLSGILAESSFNNNHLEYIVLGIGVNINQETFNNSLETSATSLKKIYSKEFDREFIIANILNIFEECYNSFKRNDLKEIINKVKKYSCVLNKDVFVFDKQQTTEGKIIDITEDGSILLQLQNGEIKEYINGEVSLRIKKDD